MDLNGRIRQAAVEAIEALGLEGVAFYGLYIEQELGWAHVHFRTLAGEYFSVKILLGGYPEQPANTTVEVLWEQIVTALETGETF